MAETETIPAGWAPAPGHLAERVLLITGAADGIGRALARACAGLGATVVLLDRNVRGLESLYDEILADRAPEPAIYPMDLKGAAPADYITLAETLQREYGCLHGLVHNAAMLGALTPMSHYDDQLWFEVLQTNLNAPYLLTRNCMELLRCAPDASVLFMADRVGRRGRAYWGAYGVSKAGIENFSRLLAEELEDNTNIRVNTYDPGPVRTALRLIAFPAEDRDALPLPEQVITPCLYLLGAVSRGVSGRQFAFRGS